MARLEYRLLAPEQDYPVLYFYDQMRREEVAARFVCDRFVKEGKAYERTSCAVEPAAWVIYLQPAPPGPALPAAVTATAGVPLEVALCPAGLSSARREVVLSFLQYDELQLQLLADYWLYQGREWRKVATELDEDRRTYVYYMEAVEEEA